MVIANRGSVKHFRIITEPKPLGGPRAHCRLSVPGYPGLSPGPSSIFPGRPGPVSPAPPVSYDNRPFPRLANKDAFL